MSPISSEDLLLLGKVLRPHGLGGLMRIQSFAQSKESFLHARYIFLEVNPGEFQELKVISIKQHKNIFLLKLRGLDSIDAVERFRGANLFIKRDSLERKSEDEYFWFELIGLRVFLNGGPCIGTIGDIITTGSNDIYVVREGDKELLVPALQDVVLDIDIKNNKMIIKENRGLLGLNEV